MSTTAEKRHQHNDRLMEQCVAIMREHDKHAEAIGFSRCGCEYCRVVRFYESQTHETIKRLEERIQELETCIAEHWASHDECSFDILHRVCNGCRCERRDKK